MANNQKLFYTLEETASTDFAKSGISNALGLVYPNNPTDDSFGYFIANGKQYGASHYQISQIAATAEKNAKDYADGLGANYAVNETVNANIVMGDKTYKLQFNEENKLTVVEYVKTTISSFGYKLGCSLADFCYSYIPNDNNKWLYVGTTYNPASGDDEHAYFGLVPHKNAYLCMQMVINNPTANKFEYNITGASAYMDTLSATNITATSKTIEVNWGKVEDAFSTTLFTPTGTVTWSNTYTCTCTIDSQLVDGENVVTYSITEGGVKTQGNFTITPYSIKYNINAKALVAVADNESFTSDNQYSDVKYGSITQIVINKNITNGAYIAIPTAITGFKSIRITNDTGAVNYENALQYVGKASKEIAGVDGAKCKMEFNIIKIAIYNPCSVKVYIRTIAAEIAGVDFDIANGKLK